MKIIIEVPDKFLEIAKGIMLGACKNENQEKELLELVDCVKAKTEPIAFSLLTGISSKNGCLWINNILWS